MLMHLLGVEVRKHSVADVLQDQGFATVADDDPFAGADLHLVHELTPSLRCQSGDAVLRFRRSHPSEDIGFECCEARSPGFASLISRRPKTKPQGSARTNGPEL